ncbi:SigB/SigF/SigG family RNA polymerase sigma factor [Nocardioides iriomotensis]|uniref:SigB/SigF/SigG family RNA polymerase sigma factor n=1 Tax=Nocardioides iriomotensis TaxID=715784 RepID=A0A4Q5IUG3_9ACTN|nr:SigB/SigF/SigG family RNA polymerase sigma factor [Nocardioides iriomotensis]RYU09530.1 SigB/SigF/SigG family RNA polymerase sigma factor [Nocardioides iriomotensis]
MSTSHRARRTPSGVTEQPLTRSQRIERTAHLLEQAQTSRPAQRHRLLDEVVVLNMPVARSVAHRYRSKGIAEDDLDQVAFMALVRAAHQFDPGFERDFLSYAVPTIRGELKKHFRDSGWTVRPPRWIQELQGRIAEAAAELTQELGRSPRPSEIADVLEEDPERVLEALSTDGCYLPDSLDRPVREDESSGSSLGDHLGDEAAAYDAAEARLLLAPVVRRLGERDRRILDLRFFHDRTQQEIADEIGVTQMHVSRLLARILDDLRSQLDEDDAAAEHLALSG